MSSSNSTTIDDQEEIVELLIMTLLGVMGTMMGPIGFYILQKSTFVNGIVRHYCLTDIYGHFLASFCHLFWGVPCFIWSLDLSYPTINYIFGFFAYSSITINWTSKVLLGMNRFVSVALPWKFYHKLQKYQHIQYFLLILGPTLCAIPLLIPGCHGCFYSRPVPNFWQEESDCTTEYTKIVIIGIGYVKLGLITFFDFGTLILLPRRLKLVVSANNAIWIQIATTFGTYYLTSILGQFITLTAMWQLTSCIGMLGSLTIFNYWVGELKTAGL